MCQKRLSGTLRALWSEEASAINPSFPWPPVDWVAPTSIRWYSVSLTDMPTKTSRPVLRSRFLQIQRENKKRGFHKRRVRKWRKGVWIMVIFSRVFDDKVNMNGLERSYTNFLNINHPRPEKTRKIWKSEGGKLFVLVLCFFQKKSGNGTNLPLDLQQLHLFLRASLMKRQILPMGE